MNRIKRSPYEILIVTIVVALAVVLAASLYGSRLKFEKGSLLTQELGMMRSALTTYKMVNKKNPANLGELLSSDYEIGGTKKPYVDRLPMSKGGVALDPFGNPYQYEPVTGWVSSTTHGYERW